MSPPITIMSRPLPSPQSSSDNEKDNDYNDSDLESIENSKKGGWNFIQALTDPAYDTKETDQNEKVYVHPLVKRSASALSSKSLEMCTESLGCETGSDVSSDEISSFSWEREKMQLPSDEHSSLDSKKSEQLNEFSSLLSFNKNRSSTYRKFTKLNSAKAGFPPPLTSISGSNGVEVRHHREGGRLIINAVAVSSCRTYFEADRTNGRLRLSLRRECSADCDCMTNKKDEEVFDEDVSNTVDEEQVLEHEDINELAEDETDEDCWNMDMDENKRKVDCEIGIGEFPRPSRCKEGGRGGKGMSNWGPFWVAIS